MAFAHSVGSERVKVKVHWAQVLPAAKKIVMACCTCAYVRYVHPAFVSIKLTQRTLVPIYRKFFCGLRSTRGRFLLKKTSTAKIQDGRQVWWTSWILYYGLTGKE
jgi:hypothetical protein